MIDAAPLRHHRRPASTPPRPMITKTLAPVAAALLLLAVPAHASDYEQGLGLGAMEILNVRTTAGFSGASAPSTAPLTNRAYLDGFNNVDSSGNLGEGAPGLASRTAYFGYTSAGQVNLSAGTIAMHDLLPPDSTGLPSVSLGHKVNPELTYSVVRVRPGSARIGVELRLAPYDISTTSTQAVTAPLTLVTDTYQLGGVVPPPAPYSGAYTVIPFTPRIGDTPSRAISTVTGTGAGSRSITAKGFLVRLGAVWRALDSEHAALELHGGPALLDIKGSFALAETFTSGTLPALASTAAGSRSGTLAAAYAGATARVRLGARWSIAGGLDWLDAGKFDIPGAGGSASEDFSHALVASLSLGYRF